MDKATEQRLDAVVEDDVRKGFRIKDLPTDLHKELHEEGGPDIRRVRFTRLNPARRRKIAEVVQRQYHRDLQNPDILSHEQIFKLVEGRGEWNKAMHDEMKRLQETTNRQMGLLFLAGDGTVAARELSEEVEDFRAWVLDYLPDPEKRAETLERFDRWLDFTPQEREKFDKKYAAAQGRDTYSSDVDLQQVLLVVDVPERVEQIYKIDDLKSRAEAVIQVQKDRIRLLELQIKHAKIFSDSVEQRRDNAEEMARMYFTTERVDENDKPLGPLAPTFEDLWNFPETVVQWLMVEAYFFQNGIPDEAREYLESFGFLQAERTTSDSQSTTSESEPSDVSPVPPTSSPDSEALEETPVASSASLVATTSTTDSSP